MKLIQNVTSHANDVIRELKDTMTREDVNKLPRFLPVVHFAIKNTRRKMEDRHTIIRDLNTTYDMDVSSSTCSRFLPSTVESRFSN